MNPKTPRRDLLLRTALLAATAAVAPLLMPVKIAAEILICAIFACATNLLIGYGGLFTFGQAAFYGLGGYAAGFLMARFGLPWPVPLVAGLLMGAVSSAIIGAFCIRRTGIYFIMMTFAFNQMIYYLAYTFRNITGGEDGLVGIKRPPFGLPGMKPLNLDNPTYFYIFVAAIFLVSVLALFRIVESPFGRVLVATRENPRRVASLGYSVSRVQLVAFMISGAFTGLAGALYAMLYWIMPIDAVHWLSSGYVVFTVLIGGTSNMFGPIIGAGIFIWLQGFFSTLWARWPLLFGAFVVIVVLFVQGGVIELFRRLAGLLGGRERAGAS